MNVADHSVFGERQPFNRRRAEIGGQGFFRFAPPEHASFRGTGHRDPNIVSELGNENADKSEPRRGLLEFLIVGRIRHGKPHFGDDFAAAQGGLEHAGEEFIRVQFPLIRYDSGAGCQRGCGVASRRVVIGNASADRAAVPNRWIADIVRQFCERRKLSGGFGCDVRVRRRGAHTQVAGAVVANAAKLLNAGQRYQLRRIGEPVLQGRDQCLPAADRLRAFRLKRLYCTGNGGRAFEFKIVHLCRLLMQLDIGEGS